MTFDEQDYAEIARATAGAKKRIIAITVSYIEGADPALASSYRLVYSGNDVHPDTGEIDCRGTAGVIHVLHFTPMPGENVVDASFNPPSNSTTVLFLLGEVKEHDCVDSHDHDEFSRIVMKPNSDRLDVKNNKLNSTKRLGYKFRLWIKIAGGSSPVGVLFDPRIINV